MNIERIVSSLRIIADELEQGSEGAATREGAGANDDARKSPSDPSTAWTEEQILATRDVVALVWHGSTCLDPYDDDAPELDHEMKKHGDSYCAEIAKVAHLFAKRTISAEEFRVFCHAYTMDESEEIEDSMRAALAAIGIEVAALVPPPGSEGKL